MENAVNIWIENIVIPTYGVGAPDKNPMFFEKRVYQGSSGVIYPNPVIEKIEDIKEDKEYIGLFLENKYLKILVLPELGGRVQMAYDKIRNRHFIYYNQVIKPALVGLAGPWISGGIEFNWPQHHRPSTFQPIDYDIEINEDGSKTVWVNEIEQMFGTKGMAGFTLYPDKAYLEIKAQLYNRTPLPQTFLWWANPAVKVNEDYQSVFPPDVNAVFDHGKRDVSDFPIATGVYYKVDYSPGTDISRYKNIPVPTSYMAINSKYDFMGGYEHDTKAGVLHVANHHVSPGKKQWTWGNGDFGIAWDRNLTDEDGPYIELMTGMYTDNQPDFSWLNPYEEKTFTQYFLPYAELGLVKNATKDLLLNVDLNNQQAEIKVYATSAFENLTLQFFIDEKLFHEESFNVNPEQVFSSQIELTQNLDLSKYSVKICDPQKVLLEYQYDVHALSNELPSPAKAALKPSEVENNEQLYLTGLHLEHYRHATYNPIDYYQEALDRDPKDIRCNNALGLWYLRRGKSENSIPYFEKAIETLTSRNPNPYDSEPYYNLGLAYKAVGNLQKAYDSFYKAIWTNKWQDVGYFSLAQIDISNEKYEEALDHISKSLDRNANNGKSYVLKSFVLRKLDRQQEALLVIEEALRRDRFNLGALFEKMNVLAVQNKTQESQCCRDKIISLSRNKGNNMLAYARDYADAGLYTEARSFIELLDSECRTPLTEYYLAYYADKLGDIELRDFYLKNAFKQDSYLCFPNDVNDIAVLECAIQHNNQDHLVPYYLGNLWYDKRQYEDAIFNWEESVKTCSTFPTAYRNLGIAYFNKKGNQEKAIEFYEKAFALDKSDARVLMELHQLYKRVNRSPSERLQLLEEEFTVVVERDDLYLEYLSLHNFLGTSKKAYSLIMARKFHPWEGGEGKVTAEYLNALVELAKSAIKNNEYKAALELLAKTQKFPENLGEGKLYGTHDNDVFYWTGKAYEGLNEESLAKENFIRATLGLREPSAAIFYNDQQPDKIFYQGLALHALGEKSEAQSVFSNLITYGEQHMQDVVEIDYFAVSLPNMMTFDDDLNLRNKIHCLYILGLGQLGLGQIQEAKASFGEVLMLDQQHFGAKIHLAMVNEYAKTLALPD